MRHDLAIDEADSSEDHPGRPDGGAGPDSQERSESPPGQGNTAGERPGGDGEAHGPERPESQESTAGGGWEAGGARMSARRRGPARAVALAVGAVVVGAGGWLLVRDDAGAEAERSPSEVVADFFLARRNGDCELLTELVTEESWSDGGRRGRRQFLEQCADALPVDDVAAPTEVQISIVGEDGYSDVDGDQAAVTTTDWEYLGGSDTTYPADRHRCPDESDMPCGQLVREDGQWRVAVDDVVLRIGRSVPETLEGYLRAYRDGDCEQLIDYLSEAAWSSDGERSREEFLAQCTAAADAREGPGRPPSEELGVTEVSFDGDDRATAGVAPAGSDATETARFVREGLQWRLDGTEASLGPAPAGTHLHALRYREIEALLLDEVQADGETCFTYVQQPAVEGRGAVVDGLPDPPQGIDVGPSIAREFSTCYLTVSVYELATEDDARETVEAMAQQILEEELPTVADLAETAEQTGSGSDLADLEAYVASRRPNQPAEVPGVPDARGLLSDCDVDGCTEATALAAEGRMLVAVHMRVGDLSDAAPLLTAQRERL